MFFIALASFLQLSSHVNSQPSLKRVCYYTNWSQYRQGPARFLPENIDPFLCTHVIYAFSKLDENSNLAPFEWNDDDAPWAKGLYSKFNDLKTVNSELKTLLAVGGWNLGTAPFTRMVTTSDTRKAFIQSAIKYLRDRRFDGLDLDWEYPTARGSPPEDREKFKLLVQELAEAFKAESQATGRPRLLLTAAVAAGKEIIDSAYDVSGIAPNLDFINLMSYDFHTSSEPVTGHNSPLYGQTGKDDTNNIHSAAGYWVSKGAPASKLVIGLAAYGRSFKLADPRNSHLGAATAGPGPAGQYTGEAGFMGYIEICQMIQRGAKVYSIEDQQVPYVVQDDVWVGYDDAESLQNKVRYIKTQGYGGVMVWSLDLDDFGNVCGQGRFPLLRAIQLELSTVTPESKTTPEPTTTPESTTSVEPTVNSVTTTASEPSTKPKPTDNGVTAQQDMSDICNERSLPDGLYPSTNACSEFIQCSNGYTYLMPCALGTVFNPTTLVCDFPSNVPECK